MTIKGEDIVEQLKRYESSKNSANEQSSPVQFKEIKEKFLKAKKESIPVLLESSELNLSHSVVIKVDYVGERFATGYVRYVRTDRVEYVPYTINYYNMAGSESSKNFKVTFKGSNPYG